MIGLMIALCQASGLLPAFSIAQKKGPHMENSPCYEAIYSKSSPILSLTYHALPHRIIGDIEINENNW